MVTVCPFEGRGWVSSEPRPGPGWLTGPMVPTSGALATSVAVDLDHPGHGAGDEVRHGPVGRVCPGRSVHVAVGDVGHPVPAPPRRASRRRRAPARRRPRASTRTTSLRLSMPTTRSSWSTTGTLLTVVVVISSTRRARSVSGRTVTACADITSATTRGRSCHCPSVGSSWARGSAGTSSRIRSASLTTPRRRPVVPAPASR